MSSHRSRKTPLLNNAEFGGETGHEERGFILRACLKTHLDRRARARGLQVWAGITASCRPGPLTGRILKQALRASLKSPVSECARPRAQQCEHFRHTRIIHAADLPTMLRPRTGALRLGPPPRQCEFPNKRLAVSMQSEVTPALTLTLSPRRGNRQWPRWKNSLNG